MDAHGRRNHHFQNQTLAAITQCIPGKESNTALSSPAKELNSGMGRPGQPPLALKRSRAKNQD